jgi:hypothetical protein
MLKLLQFTYYGILFQCKIKGSGGRVDFLLHRRLIKIKTINYELNREKSFDLTQVTISSFLIFFN